LGLEKVITQTALKTLSALLPLSDFFKFSKLLERFFRSSCQKEEALPPKPDRNEKPGLDRERKQLGINSGTASTTKASMLIFN
jgi:hypothetical protein